MAAFTYDVLDEEYRQLWDSMAIRSEKAADIDATARKILAKKTRYQAVERDTHVPWFVVGAIHALECGLRFDRHLHCGDPLTARTIHVPKGRPAAKPANGSVYTWEESAIDALTMPPHSLQKVPEWPIERVGYELERYNGWGYRFYHSETLSPYLWSGTNRYSKGKYVADGKWSATAVSGQSGAMAIIKRLSELDTEVAAAIAGPPVVAEHEDVPEVHAEPAIDPALEFPKTDSGEMAKEPPASAPAVTAHMEAHSALQNTSWLYTVYTGLLKLMRVGATGGTVGLFAGVQSDPVGTTGLVIDFGKSHGWQVAGAILAAVVLFELFRFLQREWAIKKEAAQ